ncbi:MFS transporter [Alicyclobacillus acidoterrestris]|uniref:MFS transporter n=1 Tax=Alicyclobacillus suci TaxID=2816080 RepID=UPI001190900C|nr:MFS transporter [Alicyclobacillus suci]GEO26499.1 MFS transporter [Alicyclobacillus acidoterrestris]
MKAYSVEESAIRKVKIYILPFVFLLYVVSYIDRANVGYAALTMNKALGISSQAFGLLSGIFFIGYFLFEVPSNMLMRKVGAKKWIARILISWGIIDLLTTWAQNTTHIFVIRFLLGVAEAGLFPGIILYLTYWFPAKEQARAFAIFMLAIPASNIISAPVSTWVMSHVHWFGLAGWRWMFFIEAIPAILLGVITLFFLVDNPDKAKWLSREERQWLIDKLNREDAVKPVQAHRRLEVFRQPSLWRFSVIYLSVTMGSYSVSLWLPTIVSSFSKILTPFEVGLITMIPYIIGGVSMILWSRHSDRTDERRVHTWLPSLVGVVGLFICGYGHNPVIMIIGMTLTVMGIYCFFGPFWALPAEYLNKDTSAAGLATINSIGNIGGFVGPYVIGYLKGATGNVNAGLYFLCGGFILGLLLLLSIRKKRDSGQSTLRAES